MRILRLRSEIIFSALQNLNPHDLKMVLHQTPLARYSRLAADGTVTPKPLRFSKLSGQDYQMVEYLNSNCPSRRAQ